MKIMLAKQGRDKSQTRLIIIILVLVLVYLFRSNIFSKSKVLFFVNIITIIVMLVFLALPFIKRLYGLQLLKKFMLLFCTLLLFFAIAEAVYRNIDSKYDDWLYSTQRYAPILASDNPILAYTTGSRFYPRDRFREDDFDIIFLGDSVTVGHGVNPNATFVALLSDLLNAKRVQTKFNLIMMGVNGYSILQEVEFFSKLGWQYKPDLVVIDYVLNDPMAYGNNIDFFTRDRKINRETEVLKHISAPFKCKLKNFFKKSKFLDYVVFSKNIYSIRVKSGGRELSEQIYYLENDPEFYEGLHNDDCTWQRVVFSFEQISKMAEEDNFKVMVVIYPLFFDSEQYPVYPLTHLHEKVSAEAEANGFAVLDLLPVFIEYDADVLKINELDSIHPNVLGHRVAADAIYDYFKNNHLVPD